VKGWTYGVGSYFNSGQYGGVFAVSTGVKTPATDSAVGAIVKIVNGYASGGITEDELRFTKNSIGQSDALKYETNEQKAEFLANIQRYHLPANYVEEEQRILSRMTKADIDRLAAKWLDVNRMTIIVVGDKERVFARLSGMGYKMVELDANGKFIQ
jgi:zinc protease